VVIYPILTIIFQKSLQTGCIPTDWKHVAPAYKKVKNTMQQITDQSLSLVSAVKLWNMFDS
jgi:cytochrome c551/c552